MANVLFKRGTYQAYTSLAEKDKNALYFATDANRFFLGDDEFGRQLKTGSGAPGADIVGTTGDLYLDTTALKLYRYATAWIAVGNLIGGVETAGKGNVITNVEITAAGKIKLTKGIAAATSDQLTAHTDATNNPHSVTASQVGAYTKTETETKISDAIKAIPAQTDYTVVVTTPTDENVAKRYNIKQTATGLDVNIDIPKDMVVDSGTVETKSTTGDWGAAGTYLVLTLANATKDKVYINVGDLIEYVTGEGTQVTVDTDHVVRLTQKTLTSLGLADTSVQPDDLKPYAKTTEVDNKITGLGLGAASKKGVATTVSATGTNLPTEKAVADAISTAKTAAEEYADGLNTAMDTRVKAVESAKHTHANKTVLDGITSAKVTAWDGKQDKLVFNTAYNATNNKVATMTDVNNAITDAALTWGTI